MKISGKLYDVLKYICMIALPAINACAATVMALLGVDAHLSTVITGIVAAVNTMLGALLGISSAKYYQEVAEAAKAEADAEWEPINDVD